MSGNPFPKDLQLARGERRHRRKVAGPKRWQALLDEKLGPCCVCGEDGTQLHHVVTRAHGGDDVADNLVPVCWVCHGLVTRRDTLACHTLVLSLSDSEYAYAVTKAGEDYFERQYGISYGS